MEAKGNIEVWLQRLVDSMQDTVKQVTKRAVRNVAEMGLEEFIYSHPAQVMQQARPGCVCADPPHLSLLQLFNCSFALLVCQVWS